MPLRLTLLSALSLALIPGLSWALGLGGIKTDSALNEPFQGRIELTGLAPDELETVKVTLAPEAEFAKAGSPRPHFLTRLNFLPEVSSEGKLQVLVTSPEPIREPYLDFLVEVTWPQGRLVKGYTVLLDPPTTLKRSLPPINPPQIAVPAASAAPPLVAAPPLAPQTGLSTPPPAGYPLRYGPVPSGATLITVAQRMAPEGASQAQTALAIFRANPHAFSGGNINRLKAGARLEIPHPALILAIDGATARQQFRAAQGGQPLPPLPVTADDSPSPPRDGDRLEITARQPAAEGLPPSPAGPSGPEAEAPSKSPVASPMPSVGTLAEPEDTTAKVTEGLPDSGLAQVEREIHLLREMAETWRQETSELRGRIERLETHLADISAGANAASKAMAASAAISESPAQPQSPSAAKSQVDAASEPEPSWLDDQSGWTLVVAGPLLILLIGLLILVRRQNRTRTTSGFTLDRPLTEGPAEEPVVPRTRWPGLATGLDLRQCPPGSERQPALAVEASPVTAAEAPPLAMTGPSLRPGLDTPAPAPVLGAAAPLPGPLQAREEPLELDLSTPEGLDLGVGLGLKPPPPHPDQAALADLDLDLGDLLDLDPDRELGPAVTPSPSPWPAREATGLDLDFDQALALGPEQSAGPSIEGPTLDGKPPGEALAMEAPKTGTTPLSRDWEMPTLADDSPGDCEPAADSWDEVGIKLELARAYLRMDDPEAARPLLAEAIAEGAEEQVAAAKAMLSRLE